MVHVIFRLAVFFGLVFLISPYGFSQSAGERKGLLNSIAVEKLDVDIEHVRSRPEIIRGVTAFDKFFVDRSLTSIDAGTSGIVGGIVVQKNPESIETTPARLEEFEFEIDEQTREIELKFSLRDAPIRIQSEAAFIPLATKLVLDQRPVLLTLAINYPVRDDFGSEQAYAVAKYNYGKSEPLDRFAVNPAIAYHDLVLDALRLDLKLGCLASYAPKGTTHFVLMERPWIFDSNPWRSEANQFHVLHRGTNIPSLHELELTRPWQDQFAADDFRSLNRLRKFAACHRLIYCLVTEKVQGVTASQFAKLLDASLPFYEADIAEFRDSATISKMLESSVVKRNASYTRND
jgi:hypothetical protein